MPYKMHLDHLQHLNKSIKHLQDHDLQHLVTRM
jgi:hypothetical protein